MKALKNWFSRRGALPLTAYLLALAVWLVLGAAHFGSDAAARAQGRLAEETMAVTDWQLVGLMQGADGTLTTQDGDPQMILEDVGSRVVRTISYTAEFDGEAREMCLYYTTKVGEDYSADRRVFPQSLGSGQYVYTLPRTSLAALRLDPCSPEENKTVALTMSDITLNAADTLPAAPHNDNRHPKRATRGNAETAIPKPAPELAYRHLVTKKQRLIITISDGFLMEMDA